MIEAVVSNHWPVVSSNGSVVSNNGFVVSNHGSVVSNNGPVVSKYAPVLLQQGVERTSPPPSPMSTPSRHTHKRKVPANQVTRGKTVQPNDKLSNAKPMYPMARIDKKYTRKQTHSENLNFPMAPTAFQRAKHLSNKRTKFPTRLHRANLICMASV